jgi:hypothetical protein
LQWQRLASERANKATARTVKAALSQVCLPTTGEKNAART